MRCPRCGSYNLMYMKAHHSRGCLGGIIRAILILCTGGLWLLASPPGGATHTQIVCKYCGCSWRV